MGRAIPNLFTRETSRVAIGEALFLALNGLFIYMSLDYFILRLYVIVLRLPVWGFPTEKLAGWLLQKCLIFPGRVPFTVAFVVISLLIWIAAKNKSAARERLGRYAPLIALILFFYFGWHIVFNYLIISLPPEIG
jgi:hypothetical protein